MVERDATGTRQPTRPSGNQWQPASRDVDHDGLPGMVLRYASYGALCACFRDARVPRKIPIRFSDCVRWPQVRSRCFASRLDLLPR